MSEGRPVREKKAIEVYTPIVAEVTKRAKKPKAPAAVKAKASKKVGEKAGKKEKKEKKVKVEKAKKANPYMMFSSANRAEVKKENPEASVTEMGSMLGKMWNELAEKDKESWKKKAVVQTAKNLKDFNAGKK